MKGIRLISALLVCALCALAGEPWDDKEPKSWSSKDVEKILNKSPWAKRVATKKQYVQSEDKSNVVRSTTRNERGDLVEDDFIIAWWWSSHTVRRAFLRLYELQGAEVTQEQAQEFAETDITAPTVSIMGGGTMVAVAGKLPPEELVKMVWLETKRHNDSIYPVEAKIINDSSGKPERILFVFPEKVGDAPVVTAQDKRILFRWRLPKTPSQKPESAEQFEASFEPHKMTVKKTADL